MRPPSPSTRFVVPPAIVPGHSCRRAGLLAARCCSAPSRGNGSSGSPGRSQRCRSRPARRAASARRRAVRRKSMSQWEGARNGPSATDTPVADRDSIPHQRPRYALHSMGATPEKNADRPRARTAATAASICMEHPTKSKSLDSSKTRPISTARGGPSTSSARRGERLRGPGQWADVRRDFRGPRFAADGKLLPARLHDVFQNGVLVQNHLPLQGGDGVGPTPRCTRPTPPSCRCCCNTTKAPIRSATSGFGSCPRPTPRHRA